MGDVDTAGNTSAARNAKSLTSSGASKEEVRRAVDLAAPMLRGFRTSLEDENASGLGFNCDGHCEDARLWRVNLSLTKWLPLDVVLGYGRIDVSNLDWSQTKGMNYGPAGRGEHGTAATAAAARIGV